MGRSAEHRGVGATSTPYPSSTDARPESWRTNMGTSSGVSDLILLDLYSGSGPRRLHRARDVRERIACGRYRQHKPHHGPLQSVHSRTLPVWSSVESACRRYQHATCTFSAPALLLLAPCTGRTCNPRGAIANHTVQSSQQTRHVKSHRQPQCYPTLDSKCPKSPFLKILRGHRWPRALGRKDAIA